MGGRHAAPEARLEWQSRRGRAPRTLGMDPCQLLLGCRRDGLSDRGCRRPGQEPDRRLSAACGKCLPGSEPREVWMVRRRSTVRFRKGAPGCEHFSSMKPSTCFGRVAFEWQTPSRTDACDQAICCGMGLSERLLPGEQVLGWLGTRRTQVGLPHVMGSAKGDERPGFWGIRVKRSPNRHG